MSARCSACGRAVRCVKSTTTGRMFALDPAPMPDGAIMVLPNGAGRVIAPEQRATCVAPLYRLHRPTCPAAGGSAR